MPNCRAALSWLVGELEVTMHVRDRHSALTDGCRYALHRSGADITHREDPGSAGFEGERLAIGLPLSRLRGIGSRQDEAVRVERDLRREPVGSRLGADENEKHSRIASRCRACPTIDDLDRLELRLRVPRQPRIAFPPGCWHSLRSAQ